MSRSRKKQPFNNFCGGDSQGEWKRVYNRRLRRCNKTQLLVNGEDAIYFTEDEKGNQWDSPYDGSKRYQGKRPVKAYSRRSLWGYIVVSDLKEDQEDWDRMMRK
ncbi:MAG: hypothetical protein V3V74_07715 [Nitrosomonadaceae bacterium]